MLTFSLAASASAGRASTAIAVSTIRRNRGPTVDSRRRSAAALAADRGHGPRRLAEAGLAHVVLEFLAPDGVADHALELGVGGTAAHRLAQIRFVQREQAGAELALGCQAHAV